MGSNIEAFFETRFEAILKPPGRLLASILGAPGATGHFCKKWHRATARARFLGVPEVQKWTKMEANMASRFWPPFWTLFGPLEPLKIVLSL